jgi:hypothetical protein
MVIGQRWDLQSPNGANARVTLRTPACDRPPDEAEAAEEGGEMTVRIANAA